MENLDLIAEGILALLSVMAVVVRLTPTKKDDGLFHYLDEKINKVLDALGLPNNKKQ